MLLTLIVAGFWIIQHQLYATMPKYVIRMVGEDAKPEWLANVNPAVVVVFVVLITQLMKKRKAVSSMLVGMLLMPFSVVGDVVGALVGEVAGHRLGGTHAVRHASTDHHDDCRNCDPRPR